METFLGLMALLLVLAIPVALILAILAAVRARRVEERLAAIERRLAARHPAAETEPATTPAPKAPRAAAAPPTATPEPRPTAASRPSSPAPAVPAAPSLLSAREIEKRLGARLPIWLGAIALTLAGAFLVKLSFDRGWLGPPVRVALGVAFGIVLLAAGAWQRRRAARIAQGLSAAGIAVLFVAFYAGVSLYGLVPPLAGLLLMALTTAVAVALSLQQGAMVAVLGLVGGFLTPYLVSTDEPEPRLLFLYLLLLQAGLLAVSRRREWWPLAASSFAGGLVWLFLALGPAFERWHEPWLGLFLVLSAALFVGASLAPAAGAAGRPPGELGWLASLGSFVGLAALTLKGGADPAPWIFLAILGAGALVLARLEPRFHPLAWAAAGLPALLLAVWASDLEAGQTSRLLWTALAMGALHAGGAYLALWRSSRAGSWGWLSAAAAVAFLLLAYWGARAGGLELPWGGLCLVLALVSLVAAVPLARRRRTAGVEGEALAPLAAATTAFASLAVPIELSRQWLAVAWALEVTALVWLAGRLRLPVLQRLAAILAALVAVRLLLNPAVLDYPIGEHPLFNWLLYGYGLPLAAFCAAAWLASRQEARGLSEGLQWGALGLATALVTLLVRQGFHPGRPGAADFPLTEWGTLTVAWLALAWALLRARRHWPLRSLGWGGQILLLLAVAQAFMTQVLAANPLWKHDPVGALPVLNWLLWVYGAPALLLVLAARQLGQGTAPLLPPLARLAALGLLFLLVTLEVRQAFQGSYLDGGGAGSGEQYAYSAAWIVLGLALLGAGIASHGRLLRFASLAVTLLAVCKVFLWDLAELRDLYRVVSFLGLGLSLLLVAWLYQRFVFRE